MSGAPPPTGLPVEEGIADLRTALAAVGTAVLEAEPGAGKTTVVPLRLLDEPWLGDRRVVVLEPRRLATRAAARRMAALLGEQAGETVGYRTRDEQVVGPATRVELVTEGILVRRLQHDPSLPGVGLVVFDEVHERNLATDLGLALALDARAALRPDLRVLAMSATLDTARVARVLGRGGEPAPVVRSAGRTFPVEVRWRPPDPRRPARPADAVAAAVTHALATDEGDVLAFLAGAGDVRRAEAQLHDLLGPASEVEVRSLFGALAPAEQDAALAPARAEGRRVVLATDIAETSLTVDGVRVVVDAGEVRTPRHDPRTGLTTLQTGPASQASADQRAGRAGRTAPGIAYRLWDEAEHRHRRPFAEPEIATVDLAGLALELAAWGSDGSDLAFLDPPPAAALAEARALLVELGALDEALRPTEAGRAMVDLPLHPRLARMVVGSGADAGTATALAALVEERDVLEGRPDERPADVAERLRLLRDDRRDDRRRAGGGGRGRALALVRRRAADLGRRAGLGRRARAPIDPARAGSLLALAYPDRLAQARGGGRFRLRHGGGAWLSAHDALSREAFLVVARLGPPSAQAQPVGASRADLRIELAAALDAGEVAEVAGDAVEEVDVVTWDPERDDLRRRRERRLGALVLDQVEQRPEPGPATTAALLAQVAADGLGRLAPSTRARTVQHQAAFARRVAGADAWPDLSDEALLADLDSWLAPRLLGARGRRDLAAVDLLDVLRERLGGHHRLVELDRFAPTTVTVASGRTVPVDWSGEQPTISVRAQDLYGTTRHPTVADGRVPLTVEVLSPAGRPVQVTADLPGFWAGSWKDVRKDMAGRYPKHDWPADPSRR